VNHISKAALATAVLALCACSALQSEKVDYRSASAAKSPTLDVPPDLTQLSRDSRYVVIDGAVSASGMQSAQAQAQPGKSAVAPLSAGDMRIERAGNQRWLVVNRPAEKLWDPVKDFWQESGFTLVLEKSDLGIMETEWIENRAKIPTDFIRNTFGKLFDGLYSTSERDKYRTRLERNSQGGTEIYISHRGMEETYTSSSKDQTIWQPRAADPELEVEFLRRLMNRLGATPEQSAALVTQSASKTVASVAAENGQPVVRIGEGFERAWRRVGLALDRTGFTVEDRDRAQGIYFVRYVAPNADKAEQGFFSKLFSSSSKTEEAASKMRIVVRSQGDVTTVSVLNNQGSPESAATAERIVKLLADDIK